MGYLWRIWWMIVEAGDVLFTARFPIVFVTATFGLGFLFGYCYRILFSEPGDKAVSIMTEVREEDHEYEESLH